MRETMKWTSATSMKTRLREREQHYPIHLNLVQASQRPSPLLDHSENPWTNLYKDVQYPKLTSLHPQKKHVYSMGACSDWLKRGICQLLVHYSQWSIVTYTCVKSTLCDDEMNWEYPAFKIIAEIETLDHCGDVSSREGGRHGLWRQRHGSDAHNLVSFPSTSRLLSFTSFGSVIVFHCSLSRILRSC